MSETETIQPKAPIQKILFGSPGTGKSYKVHNEIAKELGLVDKEDNKDTANIFPTIFHPEYRYGDFVGKLLPHTNKGNIEYRFYLGIFLKALARAYKNIIDGNDKNVLLIIDEINRGNTSSIFGSIFQLLDRDDNGWSSYSMEISDLEYEELLKQIGFEQSGELRNIKIFEKNKKLLDKYDFKDKEVLKNNQIKIPPNLSIVGTMNTSDESIYYMDSAFKRRWEWEYIPVTKIEDTSDEDIKIDNWEDFRTKLNNFILDNSEYVQKVEDKLVGEYFIKTKKQEDGTDMIAPSDIKYKLMFFLWDSVFSKDKSPLEAILGEDIKLKTFGDFTSDAKTFIDKINSQV